MPSDESPNLESRVSNPTNSPAAEPQSDPGEETVAELSQRIAELKRQEQALKQDIAELQTTYNTLLREQMAEAQASVARLIKEGLSQLEQRKQTLQIAVEQLERRQERIRAEMRTSFAGVSQDLAVRVQGFKDYLVGSLQDLVVAAEQLDLVPQEAEPIQPARRTEPEKDNQPISPKFAKQEFQDEVKEIRNLLDQYRTLPDYYGPAWQLRRTFEPVHAERVANWFFKQGGRGALRSMGSRLQNILLASAVISILNYLYGERVKILVLANTPERLGEWRRGLQDCLGISRADFGAEQGIVLFEAPEPLAQRADRLVQRGDLPLIIIDESENVINLAMLQFPLWLAFAADPTAPPLL